MKTRYRIETRLFHKPLLVLQIGEEYNSGDSDDMPPSCHNKVYPRWRDAVVEDLVLLGGGFKSEVLDRKEDN